MLYHRVLRSNNHFLKLLLLCYCLPINPLTADQPLNTTFDELTRTTNCIKGNRNSFEVSNLRLSANIIKNNSRQCGYGGCDE